MANLVEYGDREHSLIITLKRYFTKENFDVAKPAKKRLYDILDKEDFSKKNFDELYSSLTKINTKKKPSRLDEILIKKVYLAITIGFLLAITKKSDKKKFGELATSGALFFYLQDIRLPHFDEFLQEYYVPFFDEKAEKGLRSIVLLIIEDLIAKGWLEFFENCYASFDLNIEKDQLSEELTKYYFTKKDKLSVESDKSIEKLYE